MAIPFLHDLLRCLHRTTSAAATTALTDRELLDRYLLRQDQAAFEALLVRHGPRVLGVCRRVLGDSNDVEDAFQATFLVLLDKASRVPWHDSLGDWLAAVAHRVSVRALSSRLRRSQHESRLSTAANPTSTGEGELLWREACSILHEELDQLPNRFRLPLLLCYLEGHSRDEAAAQLGWSLGSVKAGLERGRARLRQRLLRRGVTLSAGLLAAVKENSLTAAGPSSRLLQATLRAAAGTPSPDVAALVSAALTVKLGRPVRLLLGLLLATGLGIGLCAAAAHQHLLNKNLQEVVQASPRYDPPAPDDSSGEGRIVRGRVLTPEGTPAANASLYRFDWRLPARRWVQTKVATTGADGRFAVEVRGLHFLAASADGFAADFTTVEPGDDLTLALVANDIPIRGRLLDSRGKPVAQASVCVLNVLAPPNGNLQAAYSAFQMNPEWLWEALPRRLEGGRAGLPTETKTDGDGRFELKGLGGNRVVELRFAANGIESRRVYVFTVPDFDPRTVTPTAAEKQIVRFFPDYQPAVYGPNFTHTARADHVVFGTVTDAVTGKPLARVTVAGAAGPLDGSGRPDWSDTLEVTTDTAGRFRLSGLPPARRRFLHVQPGENPYLNRVVELHATDSLPGEIKLHRCVLLDGRLTDKVTGKPVIGRAQYLPLQDNEQLKAHLDSGGYPGRFGLFPTSGSWAVTKEDGRFQLRVLPGPGVVVARAGITGSPVACYTAARAAVGDRKYLRQPDASTQSGRTDWQSVPRGASSSLAKPVGMIFPRPRREVARDTRKGRASEEVLKTNPMSPLRWEHGYAIINPDAQEESVTCAIQLDPGWRISGRIVDPDGRPLAGVKATGIHGPDERRPTTFRTDAFTAYAVDPQRPRPLFFVHKGRKLAGKWIIRADETGTPVVKLLPWASVTGHVLEADGTPSAAAQIRMQMTDSEADELIPRRLYQGRQTVETGRDGRFRLEGLFPGCEVTILVNKPGHRFRSPFPPMTPAASSVTDLGDIRFSETPVGSR
jgi:RNA polymerase sigma factor (sigma-70 family)